MHTWQHAIAVGVPLVVARILPVLPLIGPRLPAVVTFRGHKLQVRAWIAGLAGVAVAFAGVLGPSADWLATSIEGLVSGLAAAGLYSAGAKAIPLMATKPAPAAAP